MSYDINVHVGQQIENFLNSYAAADAGAMERVKNNLMDIYKNKKDDKIIEAIKLWDDKKKTEIAKIWTKANEAIRTMAISKKDEHMFIDIKEIETDVVQALNMLEGEYWDSIRGLMLKSVKAMYEPGIQDEAVPE